MKPIHMSSSHRAGLTGLSPADRRDAGLPAGSGILTDPNGNVAVAAIHNRVIEQHTHGLCRFDGDELVLAVDPAKIKEATQ